MRQDRRPGKLIAFEGLDGSGQTTQARLFTAWLRHKAGLDAHYTKEPTSGPIGSILKRALARPKDLMSHAAISQNPATLALLFAADRLDHIEREILPLLQRGTHVISDRYTLSSLAYQSLELDPKWIRSINRHAPRPDLTIFLDVPLQTCLERIQKRHPQPELYEDAAILERVEQRYREAISTLKVQRYRIVTLDGTPPAAQVHRAVVQTTKEFFQKALRRYAEDQNRIARLIRTPPLSPDEIATHRETGDL